MLNKRGDLWIISDKDEFHLDILKGQDHTSGIIEFVRLNQLPLQIKVDDYHEGPCLLAQMGYMVVKSEMDSSLLIFYIPSIVNENQKNWFLDHRYLRMEYSKCSYLRPPNAAVRQNLRILFPPCPPPLRFTCRRPRSC